MSSSLHCTDLRPGHLGYRMPAEWHVHAATMLIWPTSRTTWPGKRLEQIRRFYLDLISILSRFEPVLLLANPADIQQAERMLTTVKSELYPGRICLLDIPVNDLWARDCGPIMVCRSHQQESDCLITDWEFNAWGGKYPPWDRDNRVPGCLADYFDLPVTNTGVVLEGGAIESNGEGVLLTTSSVLLNPNRNPDISRLRMEQILYDYLGADQVVWLETDLPGDDTDGHIDNLARFVAADQILLVTNNDYSAKNAGSSVTIQSDSLHERNLKRLSHVKAADGRSVRVETLPLPLVTSPETTVDGSQRLPASYANFYIVNGGVLVPLYDKRFDNQIMEQFRRLFPDREVVGLPCRDLVWGQGGLHCIAQPLFGSAISDSYCI